MERRNEVKNVHAHVFRGTITRTLYMHATSDPVIWEAQPIEPQLLYTNLNTAGRRNSSLVWLFGYYF